MDEMLSSSSWKNQRRGVNGRGWNGWAGSGPGDALEV